MTKYNQKQLMHLGNTPKKGVVKVQSVEPNGRVVGNKIIRELSESDLEGRIKLGSGYGINPTHCAILAARHCPEYNKIEGYHVPNPDPNDDVLKPFKSLPQTVVRVDFYGAKQES